MISIKWAVSCVKHVLHIFEEQYPDNKKPRQAIEAVYNWINDPSEKNTSACNNHVKHYLYDENAIYSAAYYTVYAVYIFTPFYAVVAADYAYDASLNKSLEIKWQRY